MQLDGTLYGKLKEPLPAGDLRLICCLAEVQLFKTKQKNFGFDYCDTFSPWLTESCWDLYDVVLSDPVFKWHWSAD